MFVNPSQCAMVSDTVRNSVPPCRSLSSERAQACGLDMRNLARPFFRPEPSSSADHIRGYSVCWENTEGVRVFGVFCLASKSYCTKQTQKQAVDIMRPTPRCREASM
jgi:hypothetical protein